MEEQRSLTSRVLLASGVGLALGVLLYGWAKWARAGQQIPPSNPDAGLFIRYVGLSVATCFACGALAARLTEPKPARVFAGVFGAVFACLAGSIVPSVQWFVLASMAATGALVGSLVFQAEVQKAARFLLAADQTEDH